MVRSLEKNTPNVEEATLLLKSLRWDVDTVITNCDGERVWLGPCLNAEGKRIGITDCCFESNPGPFHTMHAPENTNSNRALSRRPDVGGVG